MRGRTRNIVVGMREGCCGQGNLSWLRRTNSCLELMQTQPLNTLPRGRITLVLNNDKMPEINGHFLK